jgi:hypothetical protein
MSSCCPTFQLNALENTGNLASGNTYLIETTTQKAFVAQQAASSCCAPVPPIYAYSGGNTSNGLLASQIRNQQLCDASQTLAVLLLQQTNSTTKLLTTPGMSARFSPAVRFQQYTRRANPVPCPPTVGNPAIPTSLLGPCTNVIGIVQTWPPS